MPAQYVYTTSTGTISVDTSELLTDVEKEWTAVFGDSLDLDSATPQGTLIAAEVISRAASMKNNADLANQINPNLSSGTFLSAICALLGVDPGHDSYSTVLNCPVTGDPQTVIPAGMRVTTESGDVFTIAQAVTIGADRNGLANITASTTGPIAISVGTLTIKDAVVGWGSIEVGTSSTITIGTTELTDAQLKTKRLQRLYAQGVGCVGAIQAHAMGVDNVASVKVMENLTGATGVVNGITFTTTSGMWICAAGAYDDLDFANAIYAAHQGGQPWEPGNGSEGTQVSQLTFDPYSKIQVTVKWLRAILKDVHVQITVSMNNSSASSSDINQVMVDYASGLENNQAGLQIGSPINAFEFSGAVLRNLVGVYVKSCFVQVVDAGADPVPGNYVQEVIISPWVYATLAIGNVHVVTV